MRLEVAVSKDLGLREEMEDRYYLDQNFRGRKEFFGGVYDGHGGSRVANYLAGQLHLRFESILNIGVEPQIAFKLAYESLSREICESKIKEGSCSANIFISNDRIYFANVGDSRILMIDDEVKQLSLDHWPTKDKEKERIEKAGGIIKKKRIKNEFGSIMVSRSIGDKQYLDSGMIATPDTGDLKIKTSDKMIIIASDGLFEGNVDNNKVARMAIVGGTAGEIAKALTKVAINSGSNDNVTIVVIKFIK